MSGREYVFFCIKHYTISVFRNVYDTHHNRVVYMQAYQISPIQTKCISSIMPFVEMCNRRE